MKVGFNRLWRISPQEFFNGFSGNDQISAGKCLKALIDSKGLSPPKSHDLIRLAE